MECLPAELAVTEAVKADGRPLVVRKDDPHWQNWIRHGATELLVIADLPGQFTPGPNDPRRTFIPLDPRAWKDDRLEIQVQDTLVHPMAL